MYTFHHLLSYRNEEYAGSSYQREWTQVKAGNGIHSLILTSPCYLFISLVFFLPSKFSSFFGYFLLLFKQGEKRSTSAPRTSSTPRVVGYFVDGEVMLMKYREATLSRSQKSLQPALPPCCTKTEQPTNPTTSLISTSFSNPTPNFNTDIIQNHQWLHGPIHQTPSSAVY